MQPPQELVEEIIGHLSLPGDELLIRSCSLVAKSWTYPSQKRLFKTIHLLPENRQLWLDNILSTNTVVLGHVRRLSYTENMVPTRLKSVYSVLRDYFPSFRQLEHFSLSSTCIPSTPEQLGLFSAFQHTLATLSLMNCQVTKRGLITLINYFTNLANLHLHKLHHYEDGEPLCPLSRSCFTQLQITQWHRDSLDFLDELSTLGLSFEEVIIHTPFVVSGQPEFAKRVVKAFGAGVKRLRFIGAPANGGYPNLTLSPCLELRGLEAPMLHPYESGLDLISSITSPDIEKITIAFSRAFGLPADHEYWRRLDDILVLLTERSRKGLAVVFRNVFVAQGLDPMAYLQKFHEKGRVVVSDEKYGFTYYSGSDGKR